MSSVSINFTDNLHFTNKKSVPLILQTEAAECGLACIAMICGYHGYDTNLTQLRQRFAISSRGASLKQVMAIAGQLKLATRALKLELSSLCELETPCVLHWDMNHFVVLVSATDKHILIHDPAAGVRKLPLHQADKHFTGIALELTPNIDFEPKREKQSLTLQHFWSRITGLKRSLFLLLGFSLLLQLFAIASPYYMQIVIDDVILRNDHAILSVLALGFGLLLLIEVAVSILRQTCIVYLSNRLSLQMSSNVFQHLIKLPLDYFSKRHVGDIVSRFGSLKTIREMLTTGLITAIVDGLMAIVTLLVLFVYSAKLALVVVGVVIIYAIVRYTFYRPIRQLNEEAIIAAAQENSHFIESVRAAQTIKLFEQESDRQNQWLNRLIGVLNKNIQISRWNIGFSAINQLLFGLENILIIFLAALAVMDSVFSVGMLYAFVSYKSRFIGAVDSLINQWIEFKMLNLHFERLSDIVFTPQDKLLTSATSEHVLDTHQATSQNVRNGHLSAHNMSYRYSPLDKPLFQHIHLDVAAGSTIAITGASGCGKTTLLKCLMGLLALEDGTICIDGQPIENTRHYRRHIAAVMQDDQLLSGTISDNIACFDESVDMPRLAWAAELACIHTEILSMPMQYNTLIGDMGSSLSGGQRQRLLIARALYRKPHILFMDEATSHLDLDNEAKISHHIKQLNITRIIVAHRIQTIRNADVVYQLINGGLRPVDPNSLINNPTFTSMEEDTGDTQ
ncbi:peptidase domain-containing ABC transporter [Alteromonas facilis]|uniref:peptidase domain-containing ABC transporter n=1 Tax=Alteromonas facilis TaxID=2048004 RepID=UPI000C29292E|nr:peptidase domain-containing ABC transporter [Alteromonas facilis]